MMKERINEVKALIADDNNKADVPYSQLERELEFLNKWSKANPQSLRELNHATRNLNEEIVQYVKEIWLNSAHFSEIDNKDECQDIQC